jgi:CheY-like chemotaxis protein
MISSRPTIFYCDDEQEFLDKFRKRHENEYYIRTFTSTDELLKTLKDKNEILPDLVLLDLFHEKRNATREQTNAANAALQKLSDDLAQIRTAVLDARSPRGVETFEAIRTTVEEVRSELKRVPVVMYTRRGILLLRDDQLRRLAGLRAEWMIKNPLSGEE